MTDLSELASQLSVVQAQLDAAFRRDDFLQDQIANVRDLALRKGFGSVLVRRGAATSIGNTWTVPQTFNAGIIFNAAGSIAVTSTFIEADGASGNLIVNVPVAKQLFIAVSGVNTFNFQSGQAYPVTDNTVAWGIASARWSSVASVLYNVYGAVSDANPATQLGNGFVKLGAGGATSLDFVLQRGTNQAGQTGFIMAPLIGNTNGVLELQSSGTSTQTWTSFARVAGANSETMLVGSDIIGSPGFYLGSAFKGTGTLRPIILGVWTTANFGAWAEALRITTTPALQMAEATNIILGTVTGTKFGTATTQKMAFYNSTPIVQPSAVGGATGYAAGATVATFHSDDTYTGNVGATAYTINGIVAALKNLGLVAA